MQTLDQKYAVATYGQVSRIKQEYAEGEQYKKYGAMAHKLPILIRTAGLMQALAFVCSRGTQVQQRLLIDLQAIIEPGESQTLLKHVSTAELSDYILLTQRIMAALLWYKRFAQSILGVDVSDVDQEEDTHG